MLPFTGVYCPGGLAVDSAGTVYVVVGDASVPAHEEWCRHGRGGHRVLGAGGRQPARAGG